MNRSNRRTASAWASASPSQVAVCLNVVIALVVSVAVVLHLRTQRTQAFQDVQVQVANMARAQALLIADQVSGYNSLLAQLEIRLNVARMVGARGDNGPAAAMAVHDLLRNFHDLARNNLDLLLVSEDGSYHAASDLLDTHAPLSHYCKAFGTPAITPYSAAVHVYTAPSTGHCPAPGTLLYQKALAPQVGRAQQALWMLFNPQGFRSALQKDVGIIGTAVAYRVLGAEQEVLVASGPQTDAELWDFPQNVPSEAQLPGVRDARWQHPTQGYGLGGARAVVPGTDLQVQMVYRADDAIAPVWQPVVQLWGAMAAGFLLLWWLVSFLVVRMVRRHQAEILTREQRFDRSLEFAEIGVWDWDIASGDLYWSKRVAPMFGYPPANTETSHEKFMAAIHPNDRSLVKQAIEQSLWHNAPYAISHRVVWPDGTERWLHESGNVERNARGNPVRMLGVVQDITAQRAARSHQRLLEAVVSQLNDMVLITDTRPLAEGAGHIVFVNHAFVEHTGYPQEAILGRPLEQLFGPDTSAQDIARVRQAQEATTPLRTEMLLYTHGHSRHWMELNIQPLLETDGQVSNWVVVARDTTQRKAAEAALRSSESRLAGVFASAMDAIISIDDAHRIILFNTAAQKTFGRSSEEMWGQPLDVLLPQGLRALHARHLHHYHHSTQEFNANRIMAPRSHLKALRANGEEFPIEASISRVVVDGGAIFTVILRDMTERLEAELKLHELNETLEHRVAERTHALQEALHSAEQAKRSRGEFLAKMSHEMRTPMNAVLGLTYLALRSKPNAEQATLLQKIQRSGNHLLHTINDILDFSKIDAGKLQIDREAFDLRQTLSEGLQMTEEKALEKHLALNVHIDDQVPQYAFGDALRLMQVLINYVNNAIKFTPKGYVTVRVQRAPQADSVPHSEGFLLRIEVEDSGIGLSANQIERLFESFEQADNSTTRQFGGTGLGLAICKQLANLMGGDTGVRSQEGVGSVFWFTARLQHSAQGPHADAIPDHAHILQAVQGRHVLVVDDNDLNLEVAVGILQDWGVQAVQAMDGAQALAVLRSRPVDLVLMDMHMPVMDGLEACRQIRADAQLAQVPVLAMTANARSEDHALCREAGMNDVVTKPFAPEQLLKVLGLWLAPHTVVHAPMEASEPPPPHAPAAQAEARLWDASCLSVFVGNHPAQQRRFLNKFLEALAPLEDALATQEPMPWGAIAEAAHKIKSSARTVGALRMADLCEQLERAGRLGDGAECARVLPRLLACMNQTRAAVTTGLNALQGTPA